MNILTIVDLKKSYNDLLRRGKFTGPNSAGKSTTMNCILGLLPYEGKITFEGGKSIKEWNKNVGYVPQDLAIYPELTPAELPTPRSLS